MKVLPDACTPRQVRNALTSHEVRTAMGWGELENGDLLRVAEEASFDLMIICDKNLRYQPNRRLALLELWTNHRPTGERYWSLTRMAADSIGPGEYRSLADPG